MLQKDIYTELENRIKLATYIASNAGSLIVDLYHHKLQITEKSLHDFVTELDKDIESMALKTVLEQFPDDGFYGEENEAYASKNDFEWVVDPIDGTNNFVRGLPLCGFQLAIVYKNEPVYALIHRPLLQEVYYAIKGKGAYYENSLNGKKKKLQVSEKSLHQAVGIFDAKIGKYANPATDVFVHVANKIGAVRVFGVAVFDLPAIAEGSAEFLISGIAQKYDIAAGMLLIEEAGGVAYSVNGGPVTINDTMVIFSNQHVKDELLSELSGVIPA